MRTETQAPDGAAALRVAAQKALDYFDSPADDCFSDGDLAALRAALAAQPKGEPEGAPWPQVVSYAGGADDAGLYGWVRITTDPTGPAVEYHTQSAQAPAEAHDELPPLPHTDYVLGRESDGYCPDRLLHEEGYSEDQMRAYARAALAAQPNVQPKGTAAEAFEVCAEEIERGEPWISREAASAIIRKHARTTQSPAPAHGDERAAFDAAFLSANGFHTKAELAAEWEKGLSGVMFRAGIAAKPQAKGTPLVWLATSLWNNREVWTCPRDIELEIQKWLGDRAAHVAATQAPAVKAEGEHAEFEVWEGDELFAGTSGPRAQAWAELQRYAAQCEGLVRVFEVSRVERPLSYVPVQGSQS